MHQRDESVVSRLRKSVPVVTGPPLGRLVSLKSGPPPGTRVVLRPPPVLKPGMKVKEKQS